MSVYRMPSKCVELVTCKLRRARKSQRVGFLAILSLCFTQVNGHAVVMYVSNYGNSTIERIDSSGSSSIFASGGSGVNAPGGLAFNSKGNLYVGNMGNNTIEEFDPYGHGSFFASASTPWCFAFDGNDNLYVSNTADHTIDKYGPSGNRSVFANLGPDTHAIGLAFDTSGNLYATTGSNIFTYAYTWGVMKFDPSGNESVFVNATGLANPGPLAFDRSGNLYVGNSADLTISKFSATGTYLSNFASSISRWPVPQGFAFDSYGNLYVACSTSNKIEQYDASGNRSVFADSTSGLNDPYGIAVQVPEPATWAMVILGAVAFLGEIRLHRRLA